MNPNYTTNYGFAHNNGTSPGYMSASLYSPTSPSTTHFVMSPRQPRNVTTPIVYSTDHERVKSVRAARDLARARSYSHWSSISDYYSTYSGSDELQAVSQLGSNDQGSPCQISTSARPLLNSNQRDLANQLQKDVNTSQNQESHSVRQAQLVRLGSKNPFASKNPFKSYHQFDSERNGLTQNDKEYPLSSNVNRSQSFKTGSLHKNTRPDTSKSQKTLNKDYPQQYQSALQGPKNRNYDAAFIFSRFVIQNFADSTSPSSSLHRYDQQTTKKRNSTNLSKFKYLGILRTKSKNDRKMKTKSNGVIYDKFNNLITPDVFKIDALNMFPPRADGLISGATLNESLVQDDNTKKSPGEMLEQELKVLGFYNKNNTRSPLRYRSMRKNSVRRQGSTINGEIKRDKSDDSMKTFVISETNVNEKGTDKLTVPYERLLPFQTTPKLAETLYKALNTRQQACFLMMVKKLQQLLENRIIERLNEVKYFEWKKFRKSKKKEENKREKMVKGSIKQRILDSIKKHERKSKKERMLNERQEREKAWKKEFELGMPQNLKYDTHITELLPENVRANQQEQRDLMTENECNKNMDEFGKIEMLTCYFPVDMEYGFCFSIKVVVNIGPNSPNSPNRMLTRAATRCSSQQALGGINASVTRSNAQKNKKRKVTKIKSQISTASGINENGGDVEYFDEIFYNDPNNAQTNKTAEGLSCLLDGIDANNNTTLVDDNDDRDLIDLSSHLAPTAPSSEKNPFGSGSSGGSSGNTI